VLSHSISQVLFSLMKFVGEGLALLLRFKPPPRLLGAQSCLPFRYCCGRSCISRGFKLESEGSAFLCGKIREFGPESGESLFGLAAEIHFALHRSRMLRFQSRNCLHPLHTGAVQLTSHRFCSPRDKMQSEILQPRNNIIKEVSFVCGLALLLRTHESFHTRKLRCYIREEDVLHAPQ
jgi:hypothetical protein